LLLSQGGISPHSDFPASALLLCCEKAGVDPSRIKYWKDLLDAVKMSKAAGVTPIAVGGFDKWPLQFYPALLVMGIILVKRLPCRDFELRYLKVRLMNDRPR
jgi:hypothetical protein